MYKIDNLPYGITIGKTGENSARSFTIDCRAWLRKYSGARMSLLLMQPNGTKTRTELPDDNYVVTWTPTSEELAVAGTGYIELQLIFAGVIAKSKTVEVKIEKSVEDFDAPYAPPSPSGYYIKPIGGIPAADLSEDVQEALAAAEAAQPLIDADHKLPYALIEDPPEIPTGGLKPAYYYAGLEDAIADINSYFTLKNDVTQENGSLRVNVLPDGSITVTLLDDQIVASTLRPKTSLTIDLAGYGITSTAAILISVQTPDPLSITLDARVSGSRINVANSSDSQVLVAQLLYAGAETAQFSMLGGVISVSGSKALSCAVRAVGFDVCLDGCEIAVSSDSSTSSPGCIGVWLQNGARADIKNTQITADYSGTGDGTTYAVYNQSGDLDAENCDLLADAPYGNALCYNTKAVAINETSRARMKNCSAIGLHSGVTNQGLLTIDGGTYQAIGHGGVYTAGSGISRIRNAVVGAGSYEGRAQFPGTSIHAAAFYLGSSEDDHPVVYMDGCTLDGNTSHQFIVLRETTNARLYISNTDLPTGHFIRVDQLEEGDNIVYAGAGCNIGEDNICLRTGTYEESGVRYSEITVAHDGIYSPSATEILTVDADAVAEHLRMTQLDYSPLDPTLEDLHGFKVDMQAALATKANAADLADKLEKNQGAGNVGKVMKVGQDGTVSPQPESGGGTDDYDDLTNKPSINNIPLSGNKSSSQLHLAAEDVVAYGSSTPGSGNVLWIPETPGQTVEIPEMDDLEDFVESTTVSVIWVGTQAQYDAIQNKDSSTLYLIKETTT